MSLLRSFRAFALASGWVDSKLSDIDSTFRWIPDVYVETDWNMLVDQFEIDGIEIKQPDFKSVKWYKTSFIPKRIDSHVQYKDSFRLWGYSFLRENTIVVIDSLIGGRRLLRHEMTHIIAGSNHHTDPCFNEKYLNTL